MLSTNVLRRKPPQSTPQQPRLKVRRRRCCLPLPKRKTVVGLPPNRADVIIMGVAIYEAVMQHFNLPELYVSTRGLRFGALLDTP